MIVISGGMRRAGSTLQFAMIKEILAGHGPVVDYTPRELQGKSDLDFLETPEHHVIKAHRITPEIRKIRQIPGARTFYVYRDVRDVVVSELNLTKKKFSTLNILSCEILGSVLEDFYQWMMMPDLHVFRYEDVIEDLPSAVKSISTILGFNPGEQHAVRIAENLSLHRMLQEQEKRQKKADLSDGFDRTTMLHARHIHSGAIEQWRTRLSRRQLNIIEAVARSWLMEQEYNNSRPPGSWDGVNDRAYKSIYFFWRKIRRVENRYL